MVVAAFHLSRTAGAGAGTATANFITPRIAANLIWPFLIKLCLSLKVSPQDLVSSSRFFLFQIAQIFARNNNSNNNSTSNNSSRLDRAIRLVRERVVLARDSPASLPNDDEQSLHILSMLAL